MHTPITSAALDFHPLAKNFPLMNGSEFNELVADVKANNGLHEPITLYQDKILDGRNRYRACLKAKVEPRFEKFEGDDAAATAFVISKNIHRRHLKAKEKREAIAALLKADPNKSDRQVGKIAGVSKNTAAAVRSEMEERGQIDHVEKRKDTQGRAQPAKRKRSNIRANIRAVTLGRAPVAPAPAEPVASIAPDEELALLREFARFVITRARSVSTDSSDHAEWKALRGRVQATLGISS
jgi:ParB-like chromosome segregation protein Spo0J